MKQFFYQRFSEITFFFMGAVVASPRPINFDFVGAVKILFFWYIVTLYLPLCWLIDSWLSSRTVSPALRLWLGGPAFFVFHSGTLFFLSDLPIFREGSLIWIWWAVMVAGFILVTLYQHVSLTRTSDPA